MATQKGFALVPTTVGGGGYPYQVHYTEAEWGDGDLEWIVICACRVLEREGVFERWGWAGV